MLKEFKQGAVDWTCLGDVTKDHHDSLSEQIVASLVHEYEEK